MGDFAAKTAAPAQTNALVEGGDWGGGFRYCADYDVEHVYAWNNTI